MTRIALLFWRELKAYVLSPVVWLSIGLAWFVTGLYFRFSVVGRSGGDLATMVLMTAGWCVQVQIVLAPLLTMRLLSEERRSGTFEMLVTAPVRDHEVVLGKFLAAALLNAFTWLVVPLYFLVLAGMGAEPDFGVVWSSYLGLVLVGTVFVAVGLLASATTQHQLLAGFLGLVMTIVLLFLPGLTSGLEGTVGSKVAEVMAIGNLNLQVHEFAAGVLDVVHVTYQAGLVCLFLLFAVRIVEIRKWR